MRDTSEVTNYIAETAHRLRDKVIESSRRLRIINDLLNVLDTHLEDYPLSPIVQERVDNAREELNVSLRKAKKAAR